MIRKIKSLLAVQSIPNELKDLFKRELCLINFNRSRVFIIALLAAFIFLIGWDLANMADGLWEKTGYKGLFNIHVITAFF